MINDGFGYSPNFPSPPPPTTLRDFNPDHQPSSSRHWVETKDDSTYEVLHVRDLGVLVIRAGLDGEGRLVDKGVSSFTDVEIGWRT